MKKATYSVSKYYLKNKAFDLCDERLNRDNCLYFGWLLRQKLAERGYDLATQDIYPAAESDLVIYSDLPEALPLEREREKSVLFLWESEIIKPENYECWRHANFRTVFTWRDDLVDGKKYFKLTHSQKLDPDFDPERLPPQEVVLVAANKRSRDPRELYSKRLEIISWFEKNANSRFDLYGVGWDRAATASRLASMIHSKIPFIGRLFATPRPSWRGPVKSKREILSRYRFTIAFENTRDVPGYVTEKMLDPLLAGSIPVYWGAPNVADEIDSSCFIDARKFGSTAELCEKLLMLDEQTIRTYRQSILEFLRGPRGMLFNITQSVERVIDRIMEEV